MKCPRFNSCSAPARPLDDSWQTRVMLSEDPTCFYLTEAVKADAEANFGGRGLADLYRLMADIIPAISSRHPRIRRALARAKLTGSRMNRVIPGKSGGNHDF